MFCLLLCESALAQNNAKQNQEYSDQKSIASDISASKLAPFTMPDPKNLIAINESGDGQISLPVVTVKGRKLTLPITLSYTTSGIKIEQNASEVGLGWNINIGSISRDYGAFEPDYSYTGQEYKMNCFDPNFPAQNKVLSYTADGNTVNPFENNKLLEYTGIENGTTPDEYVINIPGVKGNSFFNYNPAGNASFAPNFQFSEQTLWKIDYTKGGITVPQEISNINEFCYKSAPANNGLDMNLNYGAYYNVAAAIGIYPYVNGSAQTCVKVPPSALHYATGVGYEDYTSFTITTSDGTQYIFAKPLRAQKYLFEEEPFWSTSDASPYFTNPPTPGTPRKGYNEFWKTDYIAEWLLTEVRSNDYVDVNENGPDDADKGDWIKIEYTNPSREWINFSQTDNATSLMRQRAYVTHITTPVEKLDFDNSTRFDVNHDYFKEIFNRFENSYVYYQHPDKIQGGPYTVIGSVSNDHPLELKRYDGIKKYERLTPGSDLVQNVKFNYALKGTAQELAVSHYLIIDNNGNSVNYDPASLGAGLVASNFYRGNEAQGRGKTTLLSLEYGGNDLNDLSNNFKYEFGYNFNPSYDNIHIYQIQKQGAFAAVREANTSLLRWNIVRTVTGGQKISNCILPWKWMENDLGSTLTAGENWNNDLHIGTDELGYYYDPNLGTWSRSAWSLTSIKIPFGGRLDISLEADDFDINGDRSQWLAAGGFADYAIPSVAYYNNVAHMKDITQSNLNDFYAPYTDHIKQLDREFYYLMNANTGGLRVSSILYQDPARGIYLPKQYTYGTGHYTTPPYEYWQNYLQSWNAFSYNERMRHMGETYNPTYAIYNSIPPPYKFLDYDWSMSRLITGVRVDNNIRKMSRHYYEYIQEESYDGSKIKWLFGNLNPPATNGDGNAINPRLVYSPVKDCVIKGLNTDRYNVVELLTTPLDNSKTVGNYLTQYINSSNVVVKEEENRNAFAEILNTQINTSDQNLASAFLYSSWAEFVAPNLNAPLPHTQGYGVWQPVITNQHPFWEQFPNGLLPALGYGSLSLMDETQIAKNPLVKLAVGCGYYTVGVPGWLSQIASLPKPWDNTPVTNNDINSGFISMKNLMYADFITNFPISPASPQRYYPTWFTDNNCHIPALQSKTQQSYYLHPTELITKENF